LHSGERALALECDVALAPLTTLGIGGAARWLAPAHTADDVAAAHRWAAAERVDMFVLGGGSNLVIADDGFTGVVMHVGLRGVDFVQDDDGTVVRAGAGEPWDDVVAAAVDRGLAGLECLSGIPGSVGGTPVQNVGAYGQEVADTIERVTAFDRQQGCLITLTNAECRFAYRMSRFKREDLGRFVVCDVVFRLRPGSPTTTYPDVRRYIERHGIVTPTVAHVRTAVLEVRRQKGMVIDSRDPDTRSVGSFFMNPVVSEDVRQRIAGESRNGNVPGFTLAGGGVKIPAAWLIEHAGFPKGYGRGRAGLSTKHPLAIVNRGGAMARDVLDLAVAIKKRVVDRFGIRLYPEPVFVGFAGDDPDVSYLTSQVL
jgi:UDP-N-acetylmuramate dehydrogenase